ncbi:C45 family autoproteolytic acyltransferase/hydolase [Rubripirellula tenax]|nr:C45 family peptidase [Rubripirellula tenax]
MERSSLPMLYLDQMPVLLPLYFQLVDLGGGSDAVARFLSLYCPTPYLSGCSQAVWTRDESFLIRNYDYSSKLWEATLLRSCWNGKQVMAMSDCAWGVLDGMNEDGLAVSLAFGGRKTLGVGFGIPLILRYILEFCDTTAQATEVLQRVPSHMAYNVTVLDRSGAHATVFVSPDRDVVVSRRKLATNHQDTVDWPEHERATASLDRAHVLSIRLQDPDETHERFVERFMEPPLYQFNHQMGWGTLYTTTYNPARGVFTCRWPGYCLERTFADFTEQAVALRYT